MDEPEVILATNRQERGAMLDDSWTMGASRSAYRKQFLLKRVEGLRPVMLRRNIRCRYDVTANSERP